MENRKLYNFKIIILSVIFLSGSKVFSSPQPGTGTSALVAPEKGLFYSRYGFNLTNLGTSWSLKTDWPIETETTGIKYQAAKGPGFLSVHIDQLKSNYNLETYAKQWIRDYAGYGFDVRGAKFFQQGNAKGMVIDLVQTKKDQQLRQVIFLKNKVSVILSCEDETKTFLQSLPSCNQIIRSFTWTDTILPKAF